MSCNNICNMYVYVQSEEHMQVIGLIRAFKTFNYLNIHALRQFNAFFYAYNSTLECKV